MSAYPHLLNTYNHLPLEVHHGRGCWVFDSDGVQYLDFASGIAVCSLGHAHPRLVLRLQEQIDRIWHTSNLYQIPGQESVARVLIEQTFPGGVIFVNSGTEAVEAGIKFARHFHHAHGHAEKKTIISFTGGFHGRTYGAMSAIGSPGNASFAPMSPEFVQVPFNDSSALIDAVNDGTAAILIELLQGNSGIYLADQAFVDTIVACCEKHNVLLICDEVQSGNMRTGKMWMYEHYAGCKPDIVCTAKGLGGGFPVGACIANQRVAETITPGIHGTTFGGNFLAMSVAGAVLDIITTPEFADAVQESGQVLKERLDRLLIDFPSIFKEYRGTGLMIGLEIYGSAQDFVKRLLEQECLMVVRSTEKTMRILPPLIVTPKEINAAMDRIERVAQSFDQSLDQPFAQPFESENIAEKS